MRIRLWPYLLFVLFAVILTLPKSLATLTEGLPTKSARLADFSSATTTTPEASVLKSGGRIGLSAVCLGRARALSLLPVGTRAFKCRVFDDGQSGLAAGSGTSLPKYLYHYTDDATAALIEKSQLGLPGRTTYLTPEGGLSSLQAQIELALPQKNTATSLFRISTEGLDLSKVILQGRVTGDVFNRAGAERKSFSTAQSHWKT
jgi:hypothetical protein